MVTAPECQTYQRKHMLYGSDAHCKFWAHQKIGTVNWCYYGAEVAQKTNKALAHLPGTDPVQRQTRQAYNIPARARESHEPSLLLYRNHPNSSICADISAPKRSFSRAKQREGLQSSEPNPVLWGGGGWVN